MSSPTWDMTLLLGFILLLGIVANTPSIHYNFVTDENGLRHYTLLPEISSLNYNPYNSLTHVQFTKYENMWDLFDASLVDWMAEANIPFSSSILQPPLSPFFLVLASVGIMAVFATRYFWPNTKSRPRLVLNLPFCWKMKNILDHGWFVQDKGGGTY